MVLAVEQGRGQRGQALKLWAVELIRGRHVQALRVGAFDYIRDTAPAFPTPERTTGDKFRVLMSAAAEGVDTLRGAILELARGGQGLMDSARHVIGCNACQEMRVQNACDDVASIIPESLAAGRWTTSWWQC